MKIALRLGQKMFLSHLLAILMVSGSIGTYFYWCAAGSLKGSLQARLRNSAALVARTFEGADLGALRGAADTNSPRYVEYLRTLRGLRATNPDMAFLYLMRRDADGVRFVIDSDESNSEAPPGRLYTNSVPALLEGFQRPSVDPQIYTDEWGAFMSGYAPVRAGGGEYLVGLDMRATEVQRKFRNLQVSGTVSLCGAIALALLFSHLFGRRLLGNMRVFVNRCMAIADGRYDERIELHTGDEMDQLVAAFNAMSERLGQAREENRQAKAQLEDRVRERTRELLDANGQLQHALDNVKRLSGLLPICASCKKIRNDQGYWTQLEEYMQAHSEATFTHGCCPECMRKLYPELVPGAPGAKDAPCGG